MISARLVRDLGQLSRDDFTMFLFYLQHVFSGDSTPPPTLNRALTQSSSASLHLACEPRDRVQLYAEFLPCDLDETRVRFE
ncbi:hypothetical protein F2Q70_00018666 [Brassica cretica]|uniref:Uncharacterized protein n=1 Tax=Brassica cretica TaxID=69181 RepID=A0A8S9I5S9_BRACR|nr:hypothetical protein F2Q70_00018666 [Brassica cretica]